MHRGIPIHYDESFWQLSIFKMYGLYSIGGALTIIQDALYGSVPQAFKIDAFNFFLRYV